MVIYLVGSLRNPKVPQVAAQLRAAGYEVFDDWYAAGPEADDKWQQYEQEKGHDFPTALQGLAADHVFNFDKRHLERADLVVLATPAGKSGHLELGWALGKGKPGFILMEKQPERWDVMYRFANAVVFSVEELVTAIARTSMKRVA